MSGLDFQAGEQEAPGDLYHIYEPPTCNVTVKERDVILERPSRRPLDASSGEERGSSRLPGSDKPMYECV